MKNLLLILSLSLLIACGKSKNATNPIGAKSETLLTENNSTELAFLMSSSVGETGAKGSSLLGLWRPESGKLEESFIILEDALILITECADEDGKKYYTTLKLSSTKTSTVISVPAQVGTAESIELEDGSVLTCGENIEAMTIKYRLSKDKLFIEGAEGEYSSLKILDLDELSHLL